MYNEKRAKAPWAVLRSTASAALLFPFNANGLKGRVADAATNMVEEGVVSLAEGSWPDPTKLIQAGAQGVVVGHAFETAHLRDAAAAHSAKQLVGSDVRLPGEARDAAATWKATYVDPIYGDVVVKNAAGEERRVPAQALLDANKVRARLPAAPLPTEKPPVTPVSTDPQKPPAAPEPLVPAGALVPSDPNPKRAIERLRKDKDPNKHLEAEVIDAIDKEGIPGLRFTAIGKDVWVDEHGKNVDVSGKKLRKQGDGKDQIVEVELSPGKWTQVSLVGEIDVRTNDVIIEVTAGSGSKKVGQHDRVWGYDDRVGAHRSSEGKPGNRTNQPTVIVATHKLERGDEIRLLERGVVVVKSPQDAARVARAYYEARAHPTPDNQILPRTDADVQRRGGVGKETHALSVEVVGPKRRQNDREHGRMSFQVERMVAGGLGGEMRALAKRPVAERVQVTKALEHAVTVADAKAILNKHGIGDAPAERPKVDTQAQPDPGEQMIARLQDTEAFKQLSSGEQAVWMRMLSGDDPFFARPYREQLTTALDNGRVKTPDDLRALLDRGPVDYSYEPTDKKDIAGLAARTQIAQGKREAKEGGGHIDHFEVTVDGQTIKVKVENAADPSAVIKQVAEAYGKLPYQARGHATEIYVASSPHPRHPSALMQAQSDGRIAIYPSAFALKGHAFDVTIMHEFAHTIAYARAPLEPTQTNAFWQKWFAAGAADGVPISRYGKTDPHEDFAEAVSVYLQARGTRDEAAVKAKMGERWKMIEDVLSVQSVDPTVPILGNRETKAWAAQAIDQKNGTAALSRVIDGKRYEQTVAISTLVRRDPSLVTGIRVGELDVSGLDPHTGKLLLVDRQGRAAGKISVDELTKQAPAAVLKALREGSLAPDGGTIAVDVAKLPPDEARIVANADRMHALEVHLGPMDGGITYTFAGLARDGSVLLNAKTAGYTAMTMPLKDFANLPDVEAYLSGLGHVGAPKPYDPGPDVRRLYDARDDLKGLQVDVDGVRYGFSKLEDGVVTLVGFDPPHPTLVLPLATAAQNHNVVAYLDRLPKRAAAEPAAPPKVEGVAKAMEGPTIRERRTLDPASEQLSLAVAMHVVETYVAKHGPPPDAAAQRWWVKAVSDEAVAIRVKADVHGDVVRTAAALSSDPGYRARINTYLALPADVRTTGGAGLLLYATYGGDAKAIDRFGAWAKQHPKEAQALGATLEKLFIPIEHTAVNAERSIMLPDGMMSAAELQTRRDIALGERSAFDEMMSTALDRVTAGKPLGPPFSPAEGLTQAIKIVRDPQRDSQLAELWAVLKGAKTDQDAAILLGTVHAQERFGFPFDAAAVRAAAAEHAKLAKAKDGSVTDIYYRAAGVTKPDNLRASPYRPEPRVKEPVVAAVDHDVAIQQALAVKDAAFDANYGATMTKVFGKPVSRAALEAAFSVPGYRTALIAVETSNLDVNGTGMKLSFVIRDAQGNFVAPMDRKIYRSNVDGALVMDRSLLMLDQRYQGAKLQEAINDRTLAFLGWATGYDKNTRITVTANISVGVYAWAGSFKFKDTSNRNWVASRFVDFLDRMAVQHPNEFTPDRIEYLKRLLPSLKEPRDFAALKLVDPVTKKEIAVTYKSTDAELDLKGAGLGKAFLLTGKVMSWEGVQHPFANGRPVKARAMEAPASGKRDLEAQTKWLGEREARNKALGREVKPRSIDEPSTAVAGLDAYYAKEGAARLGGHAANIAEHPDYKPFYDTASKALDPNAYPELNPHKQPLQRPGDGKSSDVSYFTENGKTLYFKPIAEGNADRIMAEIATHELAQLLGLEVTARITIGKVNGRLGMVSEALPASYEKLKTKPDADGYPYEKPWREAFADLQAFDYLTGHTDRNLGNIYIDEKTHKVMVIDHENSFSEGVIPTRRADLPISGGILPLEELSPKLSETLTKLTPDAIRGRLKGKLSPPQIEMIVARYYMLKQHLENR